jgi:hypothetical protein
MVGVGRRADYLSLLRPHFTDALPDDLHVRTYVHTQCKKVNPNPELRGGIKYVPQFFFGKRNLIKV